MTELETLERAKMYMEKLANGINPIDGSAIPDEDVVNNLRLSRCFFYVADVLRRVIDNGGVTPQKKPKKEAFTLTAEQREAFDFSTTPIPISELSKTKQFYEDFDHIWQTRKEWKAVYAMIGPYAEENGDQYVALVNDARKEYMLIFSDHLENGFEDAHFKFVSEDAFIAFVEQLKNTNYKILSCSEEFFYMELEDL